MSWKCPGPFHLDHNWQPAGHLQSQLFRSHCRHPRVSNPRGYKRRSFLRNPSYFFIHGDITTNNELFYYGTNTDTEALVGRRIFLASAG